MSLRALAKKVLGLGLGILESTSRGVQSVPHILIESTDSSPISTGELSAETIHTDLEGRTLKTKLWLISAQVVKECGREPT